MQLPIAHCGSLYHAAVSNATTGAQELHLTWYKSPHTDPSTAEEFTEKYTLDITLDCTVAPSSATYDRVSDTALPYLLVKVTVSQPSLEQDSDDFPLASELGKAMKQQTVFVTVECLRCSRIALF